MSMAKAKKKEREEDVGKQTQPGGKVISCKL
jgi:hypothetical protein